MLDFMYWSSEFTASVSQDFSPSSYIKTKKQQQQQQQKKKYSINFQSELIHFVIRNLIPPPSSRHNHA